MTSWLSSLGNYSIMWCHQNESEIFATGWSKSCEFDKKLKKKKNPAPKALIQKKNSLLNGKRKTL